jgi:hypothetical protein
MTSLTQPTPITHPRHWWRRVARTWPFLVWLALLILFCRLNSSSSRLGDLSGVADVSAENIAALETVRVRTVLVQPGQAVKPGDAIAEVDTSLSGTNSPAGQDPLRKAGYSLYASRSGIVSRVSHVTGDVVQSGGSIVRIIGAKSVTIQCFLPQTYLGEAAVGERAFIKRSKNDGKTITATVVAVAPEMQALPGHSKDSGNIQRGRAITLKIDGKESLVPGETVRISTDRPGWFRQWLLAK